MTDDQKREEFIRIITQAFKGMTSSVNEITKTIENTNTVLEKLGESLDTSQDK